MTARTPGRLVLSVDLDEWFHSRRWLDGEQARGVQDTDALLRGAYGSIERRSTLEADTARLLDLFDCHKVTCTFFVLGEVATRYPALVTEIARRGHEIASHGLIHVDMTVLGPERFADHLRQSADILESTVGRRPRGYRAPNLVYAPWATRILEEAGFVYDTTVSVSRPLGGKYKGWTHAPLNPYHPSYDAIGTPGHAALLELPLPCFPGLRLAAGSSILTRLFGLRWSLTAISHAIRTGDTAYYMHPWEVGARPPTVGNSLRHAVFYRRLGPWMLDALEQILVAFKGRIVTAIDAAGSQPL